MLACAETTRRPVLGIVVRFPRIDYSKVRAHWAPNIAFAQYQNATSIIPGWWSHG